jgi:hypothetical protein
VLSHPEVAALLSERFIPIAIDNVDNPNLTEAERKFLEGKGLEFCTQGMSVFTAGGKVLAKGGGYEPDGCARMLREALDAFRPDEEPPFEPLDPPGEADANAIRRPPEGGLVLHVTWRALGGLDRPQSSATTGDGKYDDVFRRALGADRLWVARKEAVDLAAGRFPAGLRRRMARCHLDYLFGGRVKVLEFALEGARLSASFRTAGGEPGRILGRIEADKGAVRSLDIVAVAPGGRIEDCGFAAALTVAPAGKRVPVAVLFSLADPASDLALVPPHRSRDKAYLGEEGE